MYLFEDNGMSLRVLEEGAAISWYSKTKELYPNQSRG